MESRDVPSAGWQSIRPPQFTLMFLGRTSTGYTVAVGAATHKPPLAGLDTVTRASTVRFWISGWRNGFSVLRLMEAETEAVLDEPEAPLSVAIQGEQIGHPVQGLASSNG